AVDQVKISPAEAAQVPDQGAVVGNLRVPEQQRHVELARRKRQLLLLGTGELVETGQAAVYVFRLGHHCVIVIPERRGELVVRVVVAAAGAWLDGVLGMTIAIRGHVPAVQVRCDWDTERVDPLDDDWPTTTRHDRRAGKR